MCAPRRATSSTVPEAAAASEEAAELGSTMTIDGLCLGGVHVLGDAVAAALPAILAGTGQDEEPFWCVCIDDARGGGAAFPASTAALPAGRVAPPAAACCPNCVANVVCTAGVAATVADRGGASVSAPLTSASAVASVGLGPTLVVHQRARLCSGPPRFD